MQQPDPSHTANLLLRSLSQADLAVLLPHLTRVRLSREQVLVDAGAPIEHVYFPEAGVASVVSKLPDTAPTEVGIFGREGMSGVAGILGADTASAQTFIQIDGSTALRMGLGELRNAMDASPTLRMSLLRYVQTFLTQISHSVVSNAHHPLEARLARWLLMCHDRMDGDDLALTHDFMAMMIGCQRTGVTITLHVLEGGGSIRSKRSHVFIRSRERLEELAGDAYGWPEAEYRKLIGPFGRSLSMREDAA